METWTGTENNALADPAISTMTGEHERDWCAYLSACRELTESAGLDVREMLSRKRACALAYLRKRAQNEGGAYSKTRVRILTPEFVQLMAKSNTMQRHRRYPWLEHLPVLQGEIDEMQDHISLRGKVLSIAALKAPVQKHIPRGS